MKYNPSPLSQSNLPGVEKKESLVVPVRWFEGLIVSVIVLLGISIWATDVMAAGDLEAGKQLYQERCSICHGPDGKGNTPTAQALTPKPRDHTDGAYMNTLSNEHLAKVIKQVVLRSENLPSCHPRQI